MSGLTPVFPECPGYGFTAQPGYLVNIVRREGGFERSDRRWARPLLTISAAPMGPREEAVVQNILNFWHAMGGRATVFAFKDWTDYKSCPTYATPTALDAPLVAVTLADTSTGYRLVKAYSIGSRMQLREITLPVGATILVSNESGDAQTDFIVDDDTGLMKPGGGFTGTPTKWGGEFNVPVRFDSELTTQVSEKQIQSVEFTLREKRLPLSEIFTAGVGAWEIISASDSGHDFRGVVYGEGKLVAVDTGANICVSDDDGSTWTVALAQADSNFATFPLPCVAYGNGKFMVGAMDVTSSHSAVYQSADGTSWSSASSVANIGGLNGVGYAGGSHWSATSVTLDTNNYLVSADDGATWTAVTTTPVGLFTGCPIWRDVGGGKIVTMGGLPSFYAPSIISSTDNGNTWTINGILGSIPDNFQVLGATGSLGFDGTTYMLAGLMGDDADEPGVVIASSVAGLLGGTPISLLAYATDGSTSCAAAVKVGGKIFVFGDNNGVFTTDDDGATWIITNLGNVLSAGQASVTVNTSSSTIIAMLNSFMARLVVV